MKRIVITGMAIVLSVNMLFTGCDFGKNSKTSDLPPITLNWNNSLQADSKISVYMPIAYENNVIPYIIEEDLSNVENIEDFNTFTEEQKKTIAKNGFIVKPSSNLLMQDTYYDNSKQGIPGFVSLDSVLHLYNQFYNNVLLNIEEEHLSNSLEQLTEAMLIKSIKVQDYITDPYLIDIAKRNTGYFLTAKMIIHGSSFIDSTYSIDADTAARAKNEYELIQNASGKASSPLFEESMDYSRYKTNGHYNNNEKFERYFKAITWFGQVKMPLLANDGKGLDIENTQAALLMAYTAFIQEGNIDTIKLWKDIYDVQGMLVGATDTINILELRDVILNTLGETPDMNQVGNKDFYGTLFEEIIKLRNPSVAQYLTDERLLKNKDFSLFGQEYLLDNNVLKNMTDSALRPIPKGLDIMAALGSKQAKAILTEDIKANELWPKYNENLKKQEDFFAGLDNSIWQSNIYSNALWINKAVLREYDSNSKVPYFMTSEAWKTKNINTVLASYAELKKDSIVLGNGISKNQNTNNTNSIQYVEPCVEVYSKLLWSVETSVKILKEKQYTNQAMLSAAEEYMKLLKLLINCSKKELNNLPLSQDEITSLNGLGYVLDSIQANFASEAAKSENAPISISMVNTDILKVGQLEFTMATGLPDEIFVVVPIEGKLYLAKGSIYNYYEFANEGSISSREWHQMNGIVFQENGGAITIGEKQENIPKQPEWKNKYKYTEKTDTNK